MEKMCRSGSCECLLPVFPVAKLVNWHFGYIHEFLVSWVNLHPEKLAHLICWEGNLLCPQGWGFRFAKVDPSCTVTDDQRTCSAQCLLCRSCPTNASWLKWMWMEWVWFNYCWGEKEEGRSGKGVGRRQGQAHRLGVTRIVSWSYGNEWGSPRNKRTCRREKESGST